MKGRFRNLAFGDVYHEPIVISNEADVQSLFEFVPLAADHDAVAVPVRLRAGDHWRNEGRIETSEPLE